MSSEVTTHLNGSVAMKMQKTCRTERNLYELGGEWAVNQTLNRLEIYSTQ